MSDRQVSATPFPDAPLSLPIPDLTESQIAGLGEVQSILIDNNLGFRAAYDYSLDYFNAMYEMRTRSRNYPWPNSSNYCLPVVFSAVNEFQSRVAGTVLQPRPVTVRGNDPVSTQYANVVEQFMNGEYKEHKWRQAAKECIHLSARDGLSWMEVMWDLQTRREFRIDQDASTGKKVRRPVDIVSYDAPIWNEIEARDMLVCPAYAPDIAAADGLVRKIYMNELDCIKMMSNGGPFSRCKDNVEKALSMVQEAMGELSRDRQGYRTYTISGRINVADVGVAPPEGIPMMRGPIEVWRGLWRIFDLDGDGIPEDNFIWTNDLTRQVLGWAPFQYWRGWPYFPLAPIPRPNRIYGFSVPEIVRFAQEEGNAQHNGRLDMLDYALNPMRYRTNKVKFADEDRRWGWDSEVIVDSPTDFGFVPPPQIPQQSQIDEDALFTLADRAVGSPQAAAQPVASGARQSQRAAQMQQAILALQSNSVIETVREWLTDIFIYTKGLYIQYGDDQLSASVPTAAGQQSVPIPKEILGLNYTVGVTGSGGPFDKEQRKNDALMLAQFLMPNPLVQGNLGRIWQISRMVLETHDLPEVTSYIGTMQDAMQQAQAMAQAQQEQQKQQMLLQLISHASMGKPHVPPGKPSQNGQPQQPQQAPV